MKNQMTSFNFFPDTGENVDDYRGAPRYTMAELFRKEEPVTWKFNPWTGALRSEADVNSDRYGVLILPPGETLKAEPPVLRFGAAEGLDLSKYLDPQFTSKPALATQIGGAHYKDLKIQPAEYVHANRLPYLEGSVVYYVTRWRDKGGIDDLRKAKHTLDILIELEQRGMK